MARLSHDGARASFEYRKSVGRRGGTPLGAVGLDPDNEKHRGDWSFLLEEEETMSPKGE
jgi:hypothetical protein